MNILITPSYGKWNWVVRERTKILGGGVCATKKDARNDARIFAESQKNANALHATRPHGAQRISYAEPAKMREGQAITNQLFKIEDTHTADWMTLTGEELDSLCLWWVKVRLHKG